MFEKPTKQIFAPILTIPEIIDAIVERYKRRTSWHKAEKALTLQVKAIMRRILDNSKERANEASELIDKLKYDQLLLAMAGQRDVGRKEQLGDDHMEVLHEIFPLLSARIIVKQHRAAVEAELEDLAGKLPIAEWFDHEDQSGAGYGSLAAIIGSAGDLHNYPTVARFWKRMSLAVMPNGRQRPMRDATLAKEHGYSKERRSVTWKVGVSLLRVQTVTARKGGRNEPGPYRIVYDTRKEYEEAKNAAGDYAEQAAKRLSEANFDKKTSAYKAYSQGKLPPLHIHARCQRYMEKRFLRKLWAAWRQMMPKPEGIVVPLSEHPEAKAYASAAE